MKLSYKPDTLILSIKFENNLEIGAFKVAMQDSIDKHERIVKLKHDSLLNDPMMRQALGMGSFTPDQMNQLEKEFGVVASMTKAIMDTIDGPSAILTKNKGIIS